MSTARVVNTVSKAAAVVSLNAEELQQADMGIGDAILLINDAGEVFDYLATALTSGYLDGKDSTLGAILRLSARAMKSAEANEFDALGLIEMKLRAGRIHAAAEIKA